VTVLQAPEWLLEPGNPAVRVRALAELCGMPSKHPELIKARQSVSSWIDAARDHGWMSKKGLIVTYSLTALAESGLTRADIPIDSVVDRVLAEPFDAGCGDMMMLRALVMLGYDDDLRLKVRLNQMVDTQLPDGGWLCLHRLRKLKRIPKTCIKSAMHALLLAGELQKRGSSFAGVEELVAYFVRRRLFYRTDDPARLVLDCRPGWRTVDVFFPIEVMRVGLPVLLEALATLGAGDMPECQEAWDLLRSKTNSLGRVILEGTLSKSYLPKERVGQPGKWPTLYALLALKARERTLSRCGG
jgi:hypothetical protein